MLSKKVTNYRFWKKHHQSITIIPFSLRLRNTFRSGLAMMKSAKGGIKRFREESTMKKSSVHYSEPQADLVNGVSPYLWMFGTQSN